MLDGAGILDRWDGPGWRWWSLAAGAGLVLVTMSAALVLGEILGERASALLMVGLLAELVVISFVGSGMLTGTTRRMSRGGLQRETATLDTDFQSDEEREAAKTRERDRQDRKTVRMGIMALPPFLTLLYLLFF